MPGAEVLRYRDNTGTDMVRVSLLLGMGQESHGAVPDAEGASLRLEAKRRRCSHSLVPLGQFSSRSQTVTGVLGLHPEENVTLQKHESHLGQPCPHAFLYFTALVTSPCSAPKAVTWRWGPLEVGGHT